MLEMFSGYFGLISDETREIIKDYRRKLVENGNDLDSTSKSFNDAVKRTAMAGGILNENKLSMVPFTD